MASKKNARVKIRGNVAKRVSKLPVSVLRCLDIGALQL